MLPSLAPVCLNPLSVLLRKLVFFRMRLSSMAGPRPKSNWKQLIDCRLNLMANMWLLLGNLFLCYSKGWKSNSFLLACIVLKILILAQESNILFNAESLQLLWVKERAQLQLGWFKHSVLISDLMRLQLCANHHKAQRLASKASYAKSVIYQLVTTEVKVWLKMCKNDVPSFVYQAFDL